MMNNIYISGKTIDYGSIACTVITAVRFLPVKFVIGMLRNFNARFLSKMFFVDEQSLVQ